MTGTVTTGPSHYEVLGISQSASDREIADAYASRIQRHLVAPDDQDAGGQGEARAVMRAYRTLSDPESRRDYDLSLRDGGGGSVPLETAAAPVPFMATRLRSELGRDAPDPVESPAAAAPKTPARSRPRADDVPSSTGARSATGAAALAPAALADPEPASAAEPDYDPDYAGYQDGALQEETFASGPFLAEPAMPTREIPAGAKVGAALLGVGLLATAAWLMVPGSDESGDEGLPAGAPATRTVAAGTPGAIDGLAGGEVAMAGDEGEELPADLAALVPPPPAVTVEDGAATAAADASADAADAAALAEANVFPESELVSIPGRPVAGPQPANPAGSAAAAAAAVAQAARTVQGGQPGQAGPAPQQGQAPRQAQAPQQGQAAVAQQIASRPARSAVQSLPQLRQGSIRNSDNPRGRFQGIVSVQFVVQPNGRVAGCQTADSSGNQALDQRTCQLVEQRLVFDPAVDTQGQAIPWVMRGTYIWGSRNWRGGRR